MAEKEGLLTYWKGQCHGAINSEQQQSRKGHSQAGKVGAVGMAINGE
jgi:hypothetical protein